jgi:hypothetical protein
MSRSKKPRKACRPRPITADTMALATHFAAKPSVADRAEVLGILRQAIQALREGVATEHQWSVAAGSVTVALAIERQGIVRGLQGHLKTAEQALQDIYDRALRTGGGRWVRVTLYYQELDALQTFMDLHAFQVKQLGRAEFLAAIDAAQKTTIAQGHTATLERNTERLAA